MTMSYELGTKLDQTMELLRENNMGINVVLRILEKISPEKYKKVMEELKKETSKQNE